MKVSSTACLFALVAIASSFSIALAEDDDYCYDNLTDIANREIRLAANGDDTSQIREYILCPHTDFQIGTPTQNGLTYENGDLPLVVLNPNMHVICGRDGSPTNKCTLVGGDHQVISSSPTFLPEALDGVIPDATNFLLRGVTLKGSKDIDMSFSSIGANIIIEDCVFKDSVQGQFSVYVDAPGQEQMDFAANGGDNRRLEEELIFVPPGALDTPKLDVTMRHCHFEFNRKTMSIVASIGTANVVIQDSKFVSNSIYGGEDQVGSILWFTGGAGLVADNCFDKNMYNLAAVLVNGGEITLEGNYADDEPRSQELGCDGSQMFIQEESSLGVALETKTFECTPFSESTCQAKDMERVPQSGGMATLGTGVWVLSLGFIGAVLSAIEF